MENKDIRIDMQNYYLGHIVPWLVSNAMMLGNDSQLDELKRIRTSLLVTTCFDWNERINVPRGVAMMLLLLKFRMLRLLRAAWLWKSGLSNDSKGGVVA